MRSFVLATVSVAVAAVVTVASVGASGIASVGASGGRVVRVAAPERIEVFVPAGRFLMGIDDTAARSAIQQCEIAYPAVAAIQPGTNKPVGFCNVDYQEDLIHMRPRSVYLDAFAIDRDEVSVAD